MNTRGSKMNLRSKTTVRQGEAKGQNFQHVLRKKTTPSTEGNVGRSRSPTTSRKRPISTTPPTASKKIRRGSDERQSACSSRKEKAVSVERDDTTSEGRSETSLSDVGDNPTFVYATPTDNSGVKYEINGYLYRRDCVSSFKVIGIRCINGSSRLSDPCRVRARVFPQEYNGNIKLPKMLSNDQRRLAILSTKVTEHNHPPHVGNKKKVETPKKKTTGNGKRKISGGRKSKGDEEEEESGQESESEGASNISKKAKDRPRKADNRCSRSTKARASMAWEWLKTKNERQYLQELERGNENPKSHKKKPSTEPAAKATRNIPAPKAPAKTEGPKRNLTLLQKLRKNALLRFQSLKRQGPTVPMEGTKKFQGQPSTRDVGQSEMSSSSSSSSGDISRDEESCVLKITVHDGKYYIMDGYAYLKNRERKQGGYNLRCVDPLNCKARAVCVWKLDPDGKTKSLYGRQTSNGVHSHDRWAPGHGVEDEGCAREQEYGYTMLKKRRREELSDDEQGEGNKTEGLVEERRRRSSLLPVNVNYQRMASNYRQCLRTLIDLQDGAHVQDYPALVRLVESTGEQLIEYLTDDDMNGEGENSGIGQKTITLLNQQFKQYRALYDLFVLSSEEFQKFIDGYERWLTADSAEMWWNNGDMLEFLSRKILRSEKYRDAYAASLIKSQGSTRLRIMDRPLLPLPEPTFLRCRSSSIRQPEMRESLHGMKSMMEALRTGVDEDEEVTVDLLLKEFDEAADTFLRVLRQGEPGQSTSKGAKMAVQSRQRKPDGTAPRRDVSGNAKKDLSASASALKPVAPDYGIDGFQGSRTAKNSILKPSKSALRGIYFKYIYCLSRILKLQEEFGYSVSAAKIVTDHIDNRNAPASDQKCRTYYQSLKEYRTVCDFLTLAPAHALNILTWFQKWRTPPDLTETWKSGFVFDVICRRVLRSFRYKDLYAKATQEILSSLDASSLHRLPLLPFGVPTFLKKGKSVQKKRMRSLGLSRCVARMRATGEIGEIKAEKLLRDIDDAADAFFKYLRSNDAWPIKASLQLYLSPENNLKLKGSDGEKCDDIFDRLHQELSLMDSLCAKKTVTAENNGNGRSKSGRFTSKGSGKYRSKNAKKVALKRIAQAKELSMNPRHLLSKMEEQVKKIESTFDEVETLAAFSLQAPIEPKARKWSEGFMNLDPHDQRVQIILNDLSHLEAVMTLEELGRAVEHCQFEHRALGLILVREGRVVRCGSNRCDDSSDSSEIIKQRRVTLGVGDLSKCLPLSKIDYDSEKHTLVLNGIAVELQCAK